MHLPNTVEEAFHVINPIRPLGRDPDDSQYFVNCAAGRGLHDVLQPIFRDIRRVAPPNYTKYLFTGQRGCGKSTELLRLKRTLEQNAYFVVYIDTAEELAVADIDYPDVLLAIARQTEAQLREHANIHLLPELLEDLIWWFAGVLFNQTARAALEPILQTEYGLGVATPTVVYQRLLTAFRNQVKSSSARRLELRQAMERQGPHLIEQVNNLIRNARLRLQQTRRIDLVIILDSLDRLLYRQDEQRKRSNYETLFVEHGEQLLTPECHIIYTIPYSLVFNTNLWNLFPQHVTLANIRLNEQDGAPSTAGRETLQSALGQRLNLSAIFAAPTLVKEVIEFSGGNLRDLFRLVAYALEETDNVIQAEHIRQAKRKLALDYDYILRDDDVYRLRAVHKTKRIPNDDAHARMLDQLVVVEYFTDQRWGDVHPAVRATARFGMVAR